MDRETIIQNIVINYGKHGITREVIEPLIDSGIEQGFSYDLIYLELKAQLCELAGEEFYCTSSEMACAFGISEDEMQTVINQAREELTNAGENPDDYFREVKGTSFMI